MYDVYMNKRYGSVGGKRMLQSSTARKVYRSRSDKVFCGVIGGLATYFDVSSFWIRFAAIVLQMTFVPYLFLIYIAACFIMPKEVSAVSQSKSDAYDLPPLPKVPTSTSELENQFNKIEHKIRQLEDYVTSREFALNRKFEDLV